MNTETQKTTAKKSTPKTMIRGKKANAEILSLRNGDTPGKITRGYFLSVEPMVNARTGEIVQGNFDQDLYTATFRDIETGNLFRAWADGGFRGALSLAGIQPETPIEVEHTGRAKREMEVETPDGNKKTMECNVQTYDVYILE